MRDRVAVRLGRVVEAAVVPTWAPPTVWLRDDVQGSRPGAVRASNDAHLLHVRELCPGDGQLLWVEAPGPSVEWRPIGIDVVLNLTFYVEL